LSSDPHGCGTAGIARSLRRPLHSNDSIHILEAAAGVASRCGMPILW